MVRLIVIETVANLDYVHYGKVLPVLLAFHRFLELDPAIIRRYPWNEPIELLPNPPNYEVVPAVYIIIIKVNALIDDY